MSRVSTLGKIPLHPKDKSWSSFDSPVAAPRPVRSSTLSWPTSARVATAVSSSNPIAKENEESIRIAQDRLTYWRGVGAQASPTVERLIKQAAAKNPATAPTAAA